MSINLKIILDALDRERSISCYYDGVYRKLSPYRVGWKGGKLQCLFYQYSGKSNSSYIDGISNKNWRCLKLNKLHNIEVLDKPLFKPLIVSHKKKSSCIDKIIQEIMI